MRVSAASLAGIDRRPRRPGRRRDRLGARRGHAAAAGDAVRRGRARTRRWRASRCAAPIAVPLARREQLHPRRHGHGRAPPGRLRALQLRRRRARAPRAATAASRARRRPAPPGLRLHGSGLARLPRRSRLVLAADRRGRRGRVRDGRAPPPQPAAARPRGATAARSVPAGRVTARASSGADMHADFSRWTFDRRGGLPLGAAAAGPGPARRGLERADARSPPSTTSCARSTSSAARAAPSRVPASPSRRGPPRRPPPGPTCA